MRFYSRTALSVAIFCLLALPAAMAVYQVGDTVADFALPDAYGTTVRFSHFEGMVVVINFWQPG